jgi:hypothetical protein
METSAEKFYRSVRSTHHLMTGNSVQGYRAACGRRHSATLKVMEYLVAQASRLCIMKVRSAHSTRLTGAGFLHYPVGRASVPAINFGKRRGLPHHRLIDHA